MLVRILGKVKQILRGFDRNLILLIFCVICIILMCSCILNQIVSYQAATNTNFIELQQRVDRCEQEINDGQYNK